MDKMKVSVYGYQIPIMYEVLEVNLPSWSIDTEGWQWEELQFPKLLEHFMRQHCTPMINQQILEHDFWQHMVSTGPSHEDDDIPF